jgi:hypothetical protein
MNVGDLVRVKPSLLNKSADSTLLKQVFFVVSMNNVVVDVIDPWSLRKRSFYTIDMDVVCRRSRNA